MGPTRCGSLAKFCSAGFFQPSNHTILSSMRCFQWLVDVARINIKIATKQSQEFGIVRQTNNPKPFLRPVNPPAAPQADCANAIVNHMPASMISLITGDGWKGGGVLGLPESKGIKTCTAKEISLNYTFVKPVVVNSPAKANLLSKYRWSWLVLPKSCLKFIFYV